jgi:outer membrane protein OmpA-like peptidoglycan-associated protein
MNETFSRVAVIAALLSLAACAATDSKPKPERQRAEIVTATPSWTRSKPEVAAAATPVAAPKPAITMARPDNREDALAAHKQALRKRGRALSEEDVGYYMDTHEARFIQLVRDDRVSMQRRGNSLSLIISGGDSFASNSALLRPEMKGVLNTIARVLEEYRDTRIIISGHTDDAGEADYNQRLSERRARAVSYFFTKSGVAAERIVIFGYGESQPIADNSSAKGRATNRRIEILLEPLTR